ncbi:MAG: CDP-diacylglycerol--glycerol-3-phosphate 3-phosphatidyltransferase [Firmicutes bacterium]|nr:CDP-diacylglycerol--glycerol-3-phosphate 3-phosphatidyltransferase [Bacillota bacterium]
MNLPNRLSLVRIALIPVFVTLFFMGCFGFPYLRFAALGVFLLACLTDFLDGYIARKRKIVTDLGKFLDTNADKMLVVCAFFAFVADVYLFSTSYWITVAISVTAMLIVCRELVISFFKAMASDKGVTLSPDMIGRIKMFVQVFCLFFLIPVGDIAALNQTAADVFLYIGLSLLAVAAVLTVVSAVKYIVKNRNVLKTVPKKPENNPDTSDNSSGSEPQN